MQQSSMQQPLRIKPALRGGSLTSHVVVGDLFACFQANSKKHPDRVAIYRDSETITYGEFGAQVDALAAQLRSLQIQPQDRIGIRISRSPAFVVSVFAVLAVGGVFVPLSEGDPQHRIRELLRRAGAVALMQLELSTGKILVEDVAVMSAPPSSQVIDPLAYILYTSGSTGMPKGVAVPKKALANCLDWHAQKFGVSDGVCVSHLNLTSFDFIIAEVILPLTVGGSMAIPSASLANDVMGVIDALGTARVDVIQMVPTLMGRFIRALAASPEALRSLDHFGCGGRMICNGEVLPDVMRRSFYHLFNQAQLFNCYGPTEACVAVTEYLCPKRDEPQTMFIGKPVPNTDLYIVDDLLNDVGVDVVGELIIGGVQVANGYVADPEATAQKFLYVDNSESTVRAYRTGDLVRLWRSGDLEFIGRNDSQVKYRSLRLELGEIESAVDRSGTVEQANAIVTEPNETRGRQQLIVFVTPRDAAVHLLRSFLQSELPIDRQPTAIIALDSMPVSDRGKLDRRELIRLALAHQNDDNRGTEDAVYGSYNTGSLLAAIEAITGRLYVEDDLWPVAGMDSLALMDLELWLREKGLMFKSHACELHGIPLRSLSEDLVRVQDSQ